MKILFKAIKESYSRNATTVCMYVLGLMLYTENVGHLQFKVINE